MKLISILPEDVLEITVIASSVLDKNNNIDLNLKNKVTNIQSILLDIYNNVDQSYLQNRFTLYIDSKEEKGIVLEMPMIFKELFIDTLINDEKSEELKKNIISLNLDNLLPEVTDMLNSKLDSYALGYLIIGALLIISTEEKLVKKNLISNNSTLDNLFFYTNSEKLIGIFDYIAFSFIPYQEFDFLTEVLERNEFI